VYAAARVASAADIAIVQHEYGIYPGDDGQSVVDLISAIEIPVVTVAHTVVAAPSPNQRRIMEELSWRSATLVTMSQAARTRLLNYYDIDPRHVQVIPHGALDNRMADWRRPSGRPTILTWGLLGPGKGVEWAIEAMAELDDLKPRPFYQVIGQTHPRVLERDGTAYEDQLADKVSQLHLEEHVGFVHHYLDGEALRRAVRQCDVVLLPYDSIDQVTSGVLIEAVAAGKPVVATKFPHAQELLASGAGVTVTQRDRSSMAHGLRNVLANPSRAEAMRREAARIAPSFLWPTVAQMYRDVARRVVSPEVRSA
jgi:glycosyltransferase involved in cell wall biosynthesis